MDLLSFYLQNYVVQKRHFQGRKLQHLTTGWSLYVYNQSTNRQKWNLWRMHKEKKTTIVVLPVCNIPCKNKLESLGTLSQILANLYSDI